MRRALRGVPDLVEEAVEALTDIRDTYASTLEEDVAGIASAFDRGRTALPRFTLGLCLTPHAVSDAAVRHTSDHADRGSGLIGDSRPLRSSRSGRSTGSASPLRQPTCFAAPSALPSMAVACRPERTARRGGAALPARDARPRDDVRRRRAVRSLMPPRSEEPDIVRIVRGSRTVEVATELLRFDYGASVPWVLRVDEP